MMAHYIELLGTQWKAVLALVGAATVGAAGGAYFTLPRVVGDMAVQVRHQGEQLDALEDAVLANTRAIRLVSCVQAANLMRDPEAVSQTIHSCIATYGIGAE